VRGTVLGQDQQGGEVRDWEPGRDRAGEKRQDQRNSFWLEVRPREDGCLSTLGQRFLLRMWGFVEEIGSFRFFGGLRLTGFLFGGHAA
jgi:hypothetical protein